MRRLFYNYFFLICPSFGVTGGLCAVIVAFSACIYIYIVTTYRPQCIFFLGRCSFTYIRLFVPYPTYYAINIQQIELYLIKTFYPCTILVGQIRGHNWAYTNIALRMIPIRANWQDIDLYQRTAVLRGIISVSVILYFHNFQYF